MNDDEELDNSVRVRALIIPFSSFDFPREYSSYQNSLIGNKGDRGGIAV